MRVAPAASQVASNPPAIPARTPARKSPRCAEAAIAGSATSSQKPPTKYLAIFPGDWGWSVQVGMVSSSVLVGGTVESLKRSPGPVNSSTFGLGREYEASRHGI